LLSRGTQQSLNSLPYNVILGEQKYVNFLKLNFKVKKKIKI